MKAFIEGVRMHPCLWNPLHPEYREAHIKDDAWQRVVDHYKNEAIPNIQVAKIEWKKLRDNHRDALKRAKLGKNKLLPAQITTWKYAKAMQFLEPHMKYRITEQIEMDPPTGTSSFSDHDVTTTEATDMSTSTLSTASKRRCTERLQESPVKIRQDNDALDSFFNCILQSTRTMPQWMQTQVKKKIFAVVIEAEESLSYQTTNTQQYESLSTNGVIIETKIKSEVFTEDSSDYN